MATGIFIQVNQSGCHSDNVILNCPSYNQSDKASRLRWRFKNPSSGAWDRLAIIKSGKTKMFPSSGLQDRLTLHPNGSLGIKSLQAGDETHYQCMVSTNGARVTHMIELTVACDGKKHHIYVL